MSFEFYSNSALAGAITRDHFHQARAHLESMMDWIDAERPSDPRGSDALAESEARLGEMRAKVKVFIEEIEDWVS